MDNCFPPLTSGRHSEKKIYQNIADVTYFSTNLARFLFFNALTFKGLHLRETQLLYFQAIPCHATRVIPNQEHHLMPIPYLKYKSVC